MKKLLLLLVLVCTTWVTGCYSTTAQYAGSPGRIEEVGRTFFLAGLIDNNDPLRAYELCPEGIYSVEVVHSFADRIFMFLLFIYTPNTVRVTCQAKRGHNFYLDDKVDEVAHQVFDAEAAKAGGTLSSDVL